MLYLLAIAEIIDLSRRYMIGCSVSGSESTHTYVHTLYIIYSCEIYISNIYTNKPSDKVVTVALTLGPVMPAEFLHLTLKEYCFPGLKSVTVSELTVSTISSFPLSERYVTMYLNGPTLELLHPLKVSLTDLAVLPSIDTRGLDGAVCENVKCNNKPKVVKAISMQLMDTSVIESARHTCGQCAVTMRRAPVSIISTTSHSLCLKTVLSIS